MIRATYGRSRELRPTAGMLTSRTNWRFPCSPGLFPGRQPLAEAQGIIKVDRIDAHWRYVTEPQ